MPKSTGPDFPFLQEGGQVLREDDFIAASMEWHFSPRTGSPFWVARAGSLGFDPRLDVRTRDDLRLFPNVANELREVPLRDLVPRGYGGRPDVVGAYDSGGTTGHPKRVLLMADWQRASLAWQSSRLDEAGVPHGVDWLTVAPTGPHIFGRLMAELARMREGVNFSVDLDPRWVRRSLQKNRQEEAERYAEHVVDQAEAVLRQQDVAVLVVTPPLLERMAAREDLADLIGTKISAIIWGGAHLDADTRQLLRKEIFPHSALIGQYGSTMILGGTMERVSTMDSAHCVFDSFSPYTTFDVVDPQTGAQVAKGARGQVVMHHISKSFLLPNNLERDMVTRMAAREGAFGSAVADVAPVVEFEGSLVIEGVY